MRIHSTLEFLLCTVTFKRKGTYTFKCLGTYMYLYCPQKGKYMYLEVQ